MCEGEDRSLMIGSMKSYKNARALIGTIPKIGTGFDEATACADYDGKRLSWLLVGLSIKSDVILEQCVGRVMRAANPVVIVFVDNNPIAKKHWKAENKWFAKSGGTVEVKTCAGTEYDPAKMDTE